MSMERTRSRSQSYSPHISSRRRETSDKSLVRGSAGHHGCLFGIERLPVFISQNGDHREHNLMHDSRPTRRNPIQGLVGLDFCPHRWRRSDGRQQARPMQRISSDEPDCRYVHDQCNTVAPSFQRQQLPILLHCQLSRSHVHPHCNPRTRLPDLRYPLCPIGKDEYHHNRVREWLSVKPGQGPPRELAIPAQLTAPHPSQ